MNNFSFTITSSELCLNHQKHFQIIVKTLRLNKKKQKNIELVQRLKYWYRKLRLIKVKTLNKHKPASYLARTGILKKNWLKVGRPLGWLVYNEKKKKYKNRFVGLFLEILSGPLVDFLNIKSVTNSNKNIDISYRDKSE